jgi:hypothetical protein
MSGSYAKIGRRYEKSPSIAEEYHKCHWQNERSYSRCESMSIKSNQEVLAC